MYFGTNIFDVYKYVLLISACLLKQMKMAKKVQAFGLLRGMSLERCGTIIFHNFVPNDL